MNKYYKANMLFSVVYECVLIFVLLEMENIEMEWWQALLIAVVPAALTSFVTYIATLKSSKKSQLLQNTDSINTLIKRLGKFENRTLENMLGIATDDFSLKSYIEKIQNELSTQTGYKSDTKNLTSQHNDIKRLL